VSVLRGVRKVKLSRRDIQRIRAAVLTKMDKARGASKIGARGASKSLNARVRAPGEKSEVA
jgi:hypothetical protein